MKNIPVLLFALALALGTCACSDEAEPQQQGGGQDPAPVQVAPQPDGDPVLIDAFEATGSDDEIAYIAPAGLAVERDGTYTDKDHVALYINQYGTVPSNYITKTKARRAGWVNTEGNLWDVCPGMSIGGGGFYNDDGMMPDAPGREWFECDIDYQGGYRNAKRIVYSNDGLIYYTADHYNTFERLY